MYKPSPEIVQIAQVLKEQEHAIKMAMGLLTSALCRQINPEQLAGDIQRIVKAHKLTTSGESQLTYELLAHAEAAALGEAQAQALTQKPAR
jgi:hypothetical protein